MRNLVITIRRHLYRVGLRPKYGSIWYSPSLALYHALQDAQKKVL